MSNPRKRIRGRFLPVVLGLAVLSTWIQTLPAGRAATTTSPPRLRFDRIRYASDGCAGIVLIDAAANTDPLTQQDVSITVITERGDSEDVTLAETGADTGAFQPSSCLQLAAATVTQNDHTLQVNAGDLVVAVKRIPGGNLQTMDVALVNGGTDDGSVTITVDPTIFPEGFPHEAPSDLPAPNDAPFPIAMVEDPQGKSTMFGADQVIYEPANQSELNDFVDRHAGRLLATKTVPLSVDGQDVHANYSLIRLDPMSFDLSNTAYLMEKLGFEGTYTFSSDQAAHLIGLLLEEQITGNAVAPSTLLIPSSAPVTNEGASGNWFARPWFDPAEPVTDRVKAAEGLTVMAAADHTKKVPTAFIDSGFAGPNEYKAPWPANFNNPDYGTAFTNAARCSFSVSGGTNCSPSAVGGPNPVPCWTLNCPWHGMDMFSIAGARMDNGFGAAGSGATTVSPMFYRVDDAFSFSEAFAIGRAAADGAKVMDVSVAARCTIIVDFCQEEEAFALSASGCALAFALEAPAGPFGVVFASLTCAAITKILFGIVATANALQATVAFAQAAGAVVVAPAGNDGGDASANHVIPCTFKGVMCVGALDATGSDVSRASASDYGTAVDVWAPGYARVTPDPDTPNNGSLPFVAGTSEAAAFVTGVLADAWSIDPNLTDLGVQNRVRQATCAINRAPRLDGTNCVPSSDPRLSQAGFVDVLETVRRIRNSIPASTLVPCDGGWDEPASPGDFATSAIPVSLASTPPGGTHHLGSNLSIHALPTDRDWYTFQPRDFGAPTTEMTINLRVLGPETGKLEEQLIKVTANGSTIQQYLLAGEQTGSNGVASLSYFFDPGTTYYLKVRAPSPEATNDACYSLGFLVNGRGPTPDRFEHNEMVGTAKDLGVVNDSHVHGFSLMSPQSEERWNKHVTGLTFHIPTDKDFFTARLPDPQDPSENGHTGMLECGLQKGPGGDAVYEAVAVASPTLNPGGTAHVEYFDPAGGPLGLILANGGVDCPRRQLGSPYRLGIGLTRPGATQPARYDLDIDYKIRITRQLPAALAKALGEHLKFLSTLVGKGGCMVPRCPPEKIDIKHVITPSQFGQCAPRCGELSLINLETRGPFDVTFSSPRDLSYQLLNRNMNVVLKGKPIAQPTVGSGLGQQFGNRMAGTITKPGLYVLRVRGPRSRYSLRITSMPTGQRDITISANRTRVKRGSRVRIGGQVQSANPTCLAGSVFLERKAPWRRTYQIAAKSVLSGVGTYSFSPRIRHTRDFRVLVHATDACQRRLSPSIRIRVN